MTCQIKRLFILVWIIRLKLPICPLAVDVGDLNGGQRALRGWPHQEHLPRGNAVTLNHLKFHHLKSKINQFTWKMVFKNFFFLTRKSWMSFLFKTINKSIFTKSFRCRHMQPRFLSYIDSQSYKRVLKRLKLVSNYLTLLLRYLRSRL